MLRLLLFFFLLVFAEVKKHLKGIRTSGCVESIVAATPCAFNQRVRRLAITEQILLDVGTDFVEVGLSEKGTIPVVNVLANSLHAYASLTGLGENAEYLLIVSQNP